MFINPMCLESIAICQRIQNTIRHLSFEKLPEAYLLNDTRLLKALPILSSKQMFPVWWSVRQYPYSCLCGIRKGRDIYSRLVFVPTAPNSPCLSCRFVVSEALFLCALMFLDGRIQDHR